MGEVHGSQGGRSPAGIALILFLTTLAAYIARVNLSVALPFISSDYGWTSAEKGLYGGLLLGIFLVGYGVSNVILSPLIDRFAIGTAVFEQVVIELVRSADWSAGVVLVNGHGGNRAAVERAVRLLHSEDRKVLAWWPRVSGGDAHAGDTETSLMLAIAPHLVHMDRAEVGSTAPLVDLIAEIREGGVQSVSRNGVLGDPLRANVGHGRAILTRLSIDLVAAVDEWWE